MYRGVYENLPPGPLSPVYRRRFFKVATSQGKNLSTNDSIQESESNESTPLQISPEGYRESLKMEEEPNSGSESYRITSMQSYTLPDDDYKPTQIEVEPVVMVNHYASPELSPSPSPPKLSSLSPKLAPEPAPEPAPKPAPLSPKLAPEPAPEPAPKPAPPKRSPPKPYSRPYLPKLSLPKTSSPKLSSSKPAPEPAQESAPGPSLDEMLKAFFDEDDAFNHRKPLPVRYSAARQHRLSQIPIPSPLDDTLSEEQLFWKRKEEMSATNEELKIRLTRMGDWEVVPRVHTMIDEQDFFHRDPYNVDNLYYRKRVCTKRIKPLMLALYYYMEKEFRETKQVPKFTRWFHRTIADVCFQCSYQYWLSVDTTKIYTLIHELAKTFDPEIKFEHFEIKMKHDDWAWKAPYPENLEFLKRLATEPFKDKDNF